MTSYASLRSEGGNAGERRTGAPTAANQVKWIEAAQYWERLAVRISERLPHRAAEAALEAIAAAIRAA
jgi:hypothetical protein